MLELAGVARPLARTSLEEFAGPLPRARYTVLANRNAERQGLPPMRHWREALAAWFAERER